VSREHLSTSQLERYRQRVMDAAELLAADRHLAGCEECREVIVRSAVGTASVDSLRAALRSPKARPGVHLAYAQLAAFIDGKLDKVEREIVESHLAVCGECKADWLDLESFRNSLAVAPAPRPEPKALESWWESITMFFSKTFRWAPLQAAVAVAAVAVLVWVGSIPFRREATGPGLESAKSGVKRPAEIATKEGSAGIGIGPGDSEIVLLNVGRGRITLKRDGSLAGLEGASPEQREAAKLVLAGGPLAFPSELTEFAGGEETLLGGDHTDVPFELTSPVGTAVITDRPTFRWRPLRGAQRYEVSVYDDSYTRVAVSSPVVGTEWTPPRALGSARVYSWQVKGFRDGEEVLSPRPPAPEAKFKVLGRTQAEDLVRAQRDQAGSYLILGILFAEAGALDDAERELKALAGANPQSPIPQRLLRELEAARQRTHRTSGQ
jgi:anti-sigma factor RsiW